MGSNSPVVVQSDYTH